MNIVVFSITYHPFIGGAEVALKEITKRVKNCHFTIITLRIDKDLPKVEKEGNVTIHRIGLPSKKKLDPSLNWKLILSKYLFPFTAFLKAKKLNKELKFNASWSIMANYAGFAALFFKMNRPKIPFILTLQEGDSPEYIKRKVGLFMPLYKKIFSKADKIQAISFFLKDYAKKNGALIDSVVIPNGVDLELFSKDFSDNEILDVKKSIGKKEGDIFLITTSRLVKKNAVDMIIESLKFLPENYKLFIAGEGEEKIYLEDLVSKLGLERRVIFDGFVPQFKLPLYLKACDVFVRPSRSEGLGNSFLEAMAVRIPVIGTKVGGIPDFLQDEVTGLFCKVDDPESIAKQSQRLIKDNKLREEIIENAYKMVLNNYSWNSISNKMTDMIFSKI